MGGIGREGEISVALSFVPLNLRVSGLRAVAMAMSPLSKTSCTSWFPKPVEVPVMKKTLGMLVDVATVLTDFVKLCNGVGHIYLDYCGVIELKAELKGIAQRQGRGGRIYT